MCGSEGTRGMAIRRRGDARSGTRSLGRCEAVSVDRVGFSDRLQEAALAVRTLSEGAPDRRSGIVDLLQDSGLYEGVRILLDPGDLGRGLVEEAAASELDLPRRTPGRELQLVLEELACPFDPGVDDVEVALDAVGVEQQSEAACLVGDADREPDRAALSSRKNGTHRHAVHPRSQARGPGAAVSQSMSATGRPSRKTVLDGNTSLWQIVSAGSRAS